MFYTENVWKTLRYWCKPDQFLYLYDISNWKVGIDTWSRLTPELKSSSVNSKDMSIPTASKFENKMLLVLILLFTCYLYIMFPFLHCFIFLLLFFYFLLPTYFFFPSFAKLVKIHISKAPHAFVHHHHLCVINEASFPNARYGHWSAV